MALQIVIQTVQTLSAESAKDSLMAKYHVHVPVIAVHGAQTFEIEADSEENAVKRFQADEPSEFVTEEIEVVSLDKDNAEAELAR